MRSAKNKKRGQNKSTTKVVGVGAYNEPKPILSVAEYRKLLNDNKTTDDRILERIEYLVGFTRKIARGELQKYVARKK